jgi:hypothetical protein
MNGSARRPEDIMADVLREDARADRYAEKTNMEENPYKPREIAKDFLALGSAAVPYLLAASSARWSDEAEYAYYALRLLGPLARDAVPELERRIGTDDRVVIALFAIAPDRVLELGLHHAAGSRNAVNNTVHNADPVFVARYYRELLEQADPELVKLALSWNHAQFARRHPELVPVDMVMAFSTDEDPEIARLACEIVVTLHHADHAPRMLEVLQTDATRLNSEHAMPWLVTLAGGEALLPYLPLRLVGDALRRRRCAGANNAAPALRDWLVQQLAQVNPMYGGEFSVLVREARDLELVRAVLIQDVGGFDRKRFAEALVSYGEPGWQLVREAALREPDRLGWLETLVEQYQRPATSTVQGGDNAYRQGLLESWSSMLTDAREAYALALLFDGSAHAAFQLAWIDRGFGTPISQTRLDWLRNLGVRDDAFLDELSRPVQLPVPGAREDICPGASTTFHHEQMKGSIVRIAERAGLTSLAAYHARGEERQRLEVLTERHLERVRLATARAR